MRCQLLLLLLLPKFFLPSTIEAMNKGWKWWLFILSSPWQTDPNDPRLPSPGGLSPLGAVQADALCFSSLLMWTILGCNSAATLQQQVASDPLRLVLQVPAQSRCDRCSNMMQMCSSRLSVVASCCNEEHLTSSGAHKPSRSLRCHLWEN